MKTPLLLGALACLPVAWASTARAAEPPPPPIVYAAEVRHMLWSPDGQVLAIGVPGEATVDLWRWPAGAAPTRLQHIVWHSPKTRGDAMALAFAPDGATLAVGFSGGLLELFTTATGEHARTLHAERDDQVRALAFLPDGRSLLWASGDGRTREIDVATGATRRELTRLPDARAYSVAIAPDGRRAVTVGQGTLAVLHDLASGGGILLTSPIAAGPELRFAAFSPDGTTALASGPNAGLLGWGAADGRGRKVAMGCTFFAVVGSAPIACSEERAVYFMDLTSGEVTGPDLPRLPVRVGTIAYTADGKRLIVADHDGGVRVLDPAAGTLDGVRLAE